MWHLLVVVLVVLAEGRLGSHCGGGFGGSSVDLGMACRRRVGFSLELAAGSSLELAVKSAWLGGVVWWLVWWLFG